MIVSSNELNEFKLLSCPATIKHILYLCAYDHNLTSLRLCWDICMRGRSSASQKPIQFPYVHTGSVCHCHSFCKGTHTHIYTHTHTCMWMYMHTRIHVKICKCVCGVLNASLSCFAELPCKWHLRWWPFAA